SARESRWARATTRTTGSRFEARPPLKSPAPKAIAEPMPVRSSKPRSVTLPPRITGRERGQERRGARASAWRWAERERHAGRRRARGIVRARPMMGARVAPGSRAGTERYVTPWWAASEGIEASRRQVGTPYWCAVMPPEVALVVPHPRRPAGPVRHVPLVHLVGLHQARPRRDPRVDLRRPALRPGVPAAPAAPVPRRGAPRHRAPVGAPVGAARRARGGDVRRHAGRAVPRPRAPAGADHQPPAQLLARDGGAAGGRPAGRAARAAAGGRGAALPGGRAGLPLPGVVPGRAGGGHGDRRVGAA